MITNWNNPSVRPENNSYIIVGGILDDPDEHDEYAVMYINGKIYGDGICLGNLSSVKKWKYNQK